MKVAIITRDELDRHGEFFRREILSVVVQKENESNADFEWRVTLAKSVHTRGGNDDMEVEFMEASEE